MNLAPQQIPGRRIYIWATQHELDHVLPKNPDHTTRVSNSLSDECALVEYVVTPRISLALRLCVPNIPVGWLVPAPSP